MPRLGRMVWAAAALWLCCMPAALAQGPDAPAAQATEAMPVAAEVLVSGARILDFGEFSSTVERRERTAKVADGIKDQARDFALVRRGALFEARLGSGIGIRYQVLGAPRGAKVWIDVVVRHPAMVNPATRQPMTQSSAQYERSIGEVAHSVWSFDTPASLLPGDYAIELWHRGRMLARQAFKVTVKK